MDRLLARLDRRFGKYAIENLPAFIAGGMGLVFMLASIRPSFVLALDLDTHAVMRGQAWRLITYLFIPNTTSMFWILFSLYWIYLIGTSLEAEWGAFKLNVYYLLGMLGTTAAALITKEPQANTFLNYSLLFAFATLFPDYEIRLFLVLPIKMKWLGWLTFAYVAYAFIEGDWGARGAVIAAMANYLLFFSGVILRSGRGGSVYARKVARASVPPPDAASKNARACAICGASEADGADIRVCSCDKCKEAIAANPASASKPGSTTRSLCLEHARSH